jgi:hypothetical protein
MVIVASALDPSSQRIVRYLSETHGIGINTAFFTVFEEAGQTLLTTDWLLDQQEARSGRKPRFKRLGRASGTSTPARVRAGRGKTCGDMVSWPPAAVRSGRARFDG